RPAAAAARAGRPGRGIGGSGASGGGRVSSRGMSSSRRSFLALTGLCGAEALLHGPGLAWAGPPPSRIPAPRSAPASADAGMALLAQSRLLADEGLLRVA